MKKKSIFAVFGTVSTVLAPVAASVSFASTPSGAQTNFNNFLDSVGDKTAPNLTADLKTKFLESAFWKTYVNNGNTWKVNDFSEALAQLQRLFVSKEFTISEKTALGKMMLNTQKFLDFMPDKGFDISKTVTAAQIGAVTGNLKDTTLTGISGDLLYDGQAIVLKGVTGVVEGTDANSKNDDIFEVSNQSVLDYYLSAVINTSIFAKIIEDAKTSDLNFATGNATLYEFLKSFKTDSATLLDYISTQKTTAQDLIKISALSVLQNPFDTSTTIDENSLTLEDDAFKSFLKSDLAKLFFTQHEINTHLNSYQNNNEDFRKTMRGSIISEITVALDSLSSAVSQEISKIPSDINFTDPALEQAGVSDSVMKFAKLQMDMSENFSKDVQWRVVTSVLQGSGIAIKAGFDNTAWTLVPNDSLTGIYWKFGTNQSLPNNDYRDMENSSPTVIRDVLGSTVVNSFNSTINGYWYVPVVTDNPSTFIHQSDSIDNDFKVNFKFDFAGQSATSDDFTFSVPQGSNGHRQGIWTGNISTNQPVYDEEKSTAGFENVIFQIFDDNEIDGTFVFEKSDTSTTMKTQLNDAFNEAKIAAINQILAIKNGTVENITYDKTKTYTYQITFKGFMFENTRVKFTPDDHSQPYAAGKFSTFWFDSINEINFAIDIIAY